MKMYTCGPTVYHYVHIGNFRTFAFQDILRRWLRYRGFEMHHVMNITDVEDKIIRNAMAQGKTPRRVHRRVRTGPFSRTLPSCAFKSRRRMVRATEHIDGMVEAIGKLSEKGFHLPERWFHLLPHRAISGVRQTLPQ